MATSSGDEIPAEASHALSRGLGTGIAWWAAEARACAERYSAASGFRWIGSALPTGNGCYVRPATPTRGA